MNSISLARIAAVLSAFIGSGGGSISAGTIGLDGRHGSLTTGTQLDEFRATITGAGHTFVNVTSFMATNLSAIDALILRQPPLTNGVYTSAEMVDIHAFVNSGHGLLILGEGGFSTGQTVQNLNDLVAPFGVSYGTGVVHATGFTINQFVPHPVTAGIISIGVDYYRPMVSISIPAHDLTLLSGDNDILAAVNGAAGSGNVVLLSDLTLWVDPEVGDADRNITFGDNRLLLQNIISFLTPPRLAVQRQGNSVCLSWPTAAKDYHLQWTESLAAGHWQTLTNEVQTVAASSVVFDDTSAAERYYRLLR